MIKNPDLWGSWEARGPLREPADFQRNLSLLDAMYEYARLLGRFPPADPLEGLCAKVKMARVVNVCIAAGTDRART